ncbi:MAG: hypothetical protein AAF517_19730 [Planctomycetota bacterium]
MNRRSSISRITRSVGVASLLGFVALFTSSCDDGSTDNSGALRKPSNRARFVYDCDLQGMNAELTLEIEAISQAGIVLGSGPRPQITGVIGTGTYIYYIAGEMVSPTTRYVFTGENDFAEFTNLTYPERFRVKFVPTQEGLTLIVNPFGQGPTYVRCVLRSAEFL